MRQKLTALIEDSACRAIAGSPIKTKRERLFHVYRANSKKAWRSRKRVAAARAAEASENRKGEAA